MSNRAARALSALSVLVLSACPEETPVPVNGAPRVSIYAPIEGATMAHGAPIALSGACVDPEDEEGTVTFIWTSDLGGELAAGNPDALGNVTGTTTGLPAGQNILSLTCTDVDGGVASASVAVWAEANEAPVVAIDEPENGDGFTTDDTVTLEARVSDDVDDAQSLVVTIRSDLDGEVVSELAPDTNGNVVAFFNLYPGTHTLEVQAVDSEGGIGTSSVIVEVITDHLPPGCTIIEPQDIGVEQGTELLFRGVVTDVDVPLEELQASWLSDLDGEFAVATPDTVGVVASFHDGLSVGEHVVTLLVVDEVHFECTATTTVRVCEPNDPPAAEIDAPVGGNVMAGDPVVFAASVSDDLDASESLRIEWRSDIDGVLSSDAADGFGQVTFESTTLSPGFHLITLDVSDGCGHTTTRTVQITVDADLDGDGFLSDATGDDCDDGSGTVYPGAPEIPYDGIDQDCDGSDLVDVDEDGFPSSLVAGGTDCDDVQAAFNPGVIDIPYNGIDEDCSGADLIDVDGDGFDGGPGGPDCDDNNAGLHPGAIDLPYNEVDEDCSGGDAVDIDLDGYGAIEQGGSDCNDNDDTIFPGAVDVPYDGIDQDCNGSDRVDSDGDGYDSVTAGGPDCNDLNAAMFPGAVEVPYDGIDQDCSGSDLNDFDGDGEPAIAAGGGDCDDNNAAVRPTAVEIPYNGIDDNCAGGDEVDIDNDGYSSPLAGGTDCDDNDFLTHPNAADIPYDGVDQDCLNGDLVDVDGDGYMGAAAGGDDCNDYVPTVHPGAFETPSDGLDNDCNGSIDDVVPTAVPELVGDAFLCTPIQITGANSFGPPGPALSYTWSIAARPSNSAVTDSAIGSTTAVTTTFTPDVLGSYLLRLTVTQGPATGVDFLVLDVVTDPSNLSPTADAGPDASISYHVAATYSYYTGWSCGSGCPGQSTTLNGSGTDPEANPLTYEWTVVSGSGSVAPATSAITSATVNGGSISYGGSASFTATFRLTAADCQLQEGEDEVIVTYNCTCS